jgi:hypothetical protein
MRVERTTTYDDYWADPAFETKRPFLHGNRMRAYGDNIYHRDPNSGDWCQENSFHSLTDGSANRHNVKHDTRSENVLIGTDFAYWGGSGPQIPAHFRNYDGDDICAKRFYRVNFAEGLAEEFLGWVRSLNSHGYVGRPLDWSHGG